MCHACHEYQAIPHTRTNDAWRAMKAALRGNPWPESYACDLSTDYQQVVLGGVWRGGQITVPSRAWDVPERFVWIVRRLGTQVIDPANTAGREMYDWHIANEADAQVFAWNGRTLIPSTYAQAWDQATEDHP